MMRKKLLAALALIAILAVPVTAVVERFPVSVIRDEGFSLLYDSNGTYIFGIGSSNPTLRGAFGTSGYVIPEGAFFFRTDLGSAITLADGAWGAIPRTITALTVGESSPTTITNIRVYSLTLTPAAMAADAGAFAQSFTVNGLTTDDKVFVQPGGVTTENCPYIGIARVTSANTLGLYFLNIAVSACTPSAGTYTIVAFRTE